MSAIFTAGQQLPAAITSAMSGMPPTHDRVTCWQASPPDGHVFRFEGSKKDWRLQLRRLPSFAITSLAAGGTSTGAATFAFIQAIEQQGTRVRFVPQLGFKAGFEGD